MKLYRFAYLAIGLSVFVRSVDGQGFINLNFEQSIITSSSPSGYGFNTGTVNVPGWTEYNGWGDVNYSSGATLIYNNQPLDSPGVSLWDTTYPNPAIQGNFSIFLDGGSAAYAQANPGWPTGASIFQTAQIPSTAKSISYWGYGYNGLQVTFNSQTLVFNYLGGAGNFSIWGADISAYAGQTGELRFAAPWQSGALLDNIQFSSSSVPEPNILSLFFAGSLLFGRCVSRPRKN